MAIEFPDGWLEEEHDKYSDHCLCSGCEKAFIQPLHFPEKKEFEMLGWPLSEWVLLQSWFKQRYGPSALPTDVQKVNDTWPGPWPGITKEKE